MKFYRIKKDEKEFIAVSKDGKKLMSVDYDNMIELVREIGTNNLPEFKQGMVFDISDVTVLSPVKKPIHDILCVGVNYRDHREESKSLNHVKESADTVYFSKRTVNILGDNEFLPDLSVYDNSFDYEVELAVIIGKDCKDVSEEDAENYIFGYSIFNDGSVRNVQTRHQQWYKGKSFDGGCVMGPCIVHKSEIAYPPCLDVQTKVNGEVRQNSNTSLFIHTISQIIAEFSRGTSLEAGDIIITGTPAGVGMGFKPPIFLKSGDKIEMTIENIGKLTNIVK